MGSLREKDRKDIKVLGIIPARLDSTRLERKMLKDMVGKTLIERTYERTTAATALSALVVATDSEEIETIVRSQGATVIRSRKEHRNGSERAAEAAELFADFVPDVVAIIWGDEPLYPASIIDACVEKFITEGDYDAVSAAFKISDPAMVGVNSVGTVVTDVNDKVLYISRSLIPYNYTNQIVDYYHSTGIMVMSLDFLKKYNSLPQTPLEIIEGVEQLRILENGYSLGVIKTDANNIGVYTQEDYDKVVEIFKERERNSGSV
jgi:3-deoxy-manno-octulosonate cytidylyltransferase (CMP-KDO synthetase)